MIWIESSFIAKTSSMFSNLESPEDLSTLKEAVFHLLVTKYPTEMQDSLLKQVPNSFIEKCAITVWLANPKKKHFRRLMMRNGLELD